MSRAKPKRSKAYTLRPARLPMTIRFNSEDERTLKLIPHTALFAIVAGAATEQDWHTIACRLNVGITLARTLFNHDAAMCLATALAAICDVRERWQRVGKYGATEPERERIGAGLVLTDDMQKACTRREMRDATVHVYRAVT